MARLLYKDVLQFANQCKTACRQNSTFKLAPPVAWNVENLPTDVELDVIEKNIILREHNNNIPILRKLIKEFKNRNTDIKTNNQLKKELDKLPNSTHSRLIDYGRKPYELQRFDATNKSDTATEFSKICKQLNLLRLEHLGNYTGHRSYYLTGALATLEQALLHFAFAALKRNGFRFVAVPDILPSDIINGCGMQTHGERAQVYKIDSDMCLSGTSEMALAGFFIDELFEEKNLPIKVAAVSRCFRAETSSLHDERGIYRVHQFNKVEMFAICTEKQSENMLESFKDIEVDIFKELGLKFRLLDMPPFELGASAYQKYDIEAWMPGKNMWGEISSCSNCTDYQTKRLNIRYRNKSNEIKYAHTVNGTAAAIPRLLLSLIESNQVGNDSITLTNSIITRFMKQTEIRKDKRVPQLKLIKSIKSK